MTQIPILTGTYTDATADWRDAMPINKEPVVNENGISKGYLGQPSGVTPWLSGYGPDRGGINWNGICYRVMGSRLISISQSGAVTDYGYVGDDGLPVSMDYSFDRLAISSAGDLWYLLSPGMTLARVTDPDLGTCYDVLFTDGRFMTTDGTSLIITDLTDPTSVNPLFYGSAEDDPDPVMALCKIRNEVYAIGQYTTQNLQDVGGANFPYANNASGFIPRGTVGRKAWSYFLETFAFVGYARRERPSVYLAGAGETKSLSTQEVDKLLAALTPEQLSAIQMEQRNDSNEQRLYIHLPDRTLVYLNQASIAAGEPVWMTLREGVQLDQPYRARNMTPCYGKWIVGSADGQIGILEDAASQFWGQDSGWQFQTNFLYNASKGAILQSLELVGQAGLAVFGAEPRVFMSSTLDGKTWGQERVISTGAFGQRRKRMVWRPKRKFANFMGLRFRGVGNAHTSFTRLEGDIEALKV